MYFELYYGIREFSLIYLLLDSDKTLIKQIKKTKVKIEHICGIVIIFL